MLFKKLFIILMSLLFCNAYAGNIFFGAGTEIDEPSMLGILKSNTHFETSYAVSNLIKTLVNRPTEKVESILKTLESIKEKYKGYLFEQCEKSGHNYFDPRDDRYNMVMRAYNVQKCIMHSEIPLSSDMFNLRFYENAELLTPDDYKKLNSYRLETPRKPGKELDEPFEEPLICNDAVFNTTRIAKTPRDLLRIRFYIGHIISSIPVEYLNKNFPSMNSEVESYIKMRQDQNCLRRKIVLGMLGLVVSSWLSHS